MKRRFIVIICLWSLLTVLPAEGEQVYDKEQLDTLAGDVYRYGLEKQYDKAKRSLQQFAESFLHQKSREDHALSMDDLHRLVSVYDEAKVALTAVNVSHEERMEALTRFRLAVDAFVTQHEPMWQGMEEKVMTPMISAHQALQEGRVTAFQTALSQFFDVYKLVQPALAIDLSPEHMKQLDAHITFLKDHRDTLFYTPNKQKHVTIVKQDLTGLFQHKERDADDPSMWWGILSVGGLILSTLFYVGWKKYKGEQWQHTKKRENETER